MAFPKLDFLDSDPAKPAKPANEDRNFSNFSNFSSGGGQNLHSSLDGLSAELPPSERPIGDGHAAWLLTLSPADRRRWWRSVAEHFNRCEDWQRAEAAAVAEFSGHTFTDR